MATILDDGAAIQLVHLTKQFGRTTAVEESSRYALPGGDLRLIGPNGAGKTTTIKMLMGTLSPTAGFAMVSGVNVANEPLAVKQHVGYVPESHHIDRWMRVEEAVGFCRSLYESWNDQTCQEMLKLFDLDPQKKVKHLSKGMLVKLSLVLAVGTNRRSWCSTNRWPDWTRWPARNSSTACCGRSASATDGALLDAIPSMTCSGWRTPWAFFTAAVCWCIATSKSCSRAANEFGPAHRRPSSRTIAPEHHLAARAGAGMAGHGRRLHAQTVQQIRDQEGVEHVEVIDLGLEDLFKDFIKGRRAGS